MCLNCLPTFEKCLYCISLRDAVIIIFKVGLLLYTPLFILSIIDAEKLGLVDIDDVGFCCWYTIVMGIWIGTTVLLCLVISRCVRNEDARDIMLQVFFWLVVATSLIHLVFCLTYLVFCWSKCFTVAMIHLGAFLVHLLISVYTTLIVNSYRMSLF
ncbi:uncharacterized protein LOC135083719 isoform X2 [Ostrinia nubilalis]|uniref:uncharacterized protein LOC135083719 isoform X2 n=1 Tax=Ostrinia nubilalis TaxID=29057 RepID=UPI0030824E30